MKQWSDMFRNFSMVGQLGLSLAMPLLLCVLFCSWLVSRFGAGSWVYIPGFFFGLGGSFMTAYKVYLAVTKETAQSRKKKSGKNRGAAFNSHS